METRLNATGDDAPRFLSVDRIVSALMDGGFDASWYPGRTGSERERTDVPVISANWNRVPGSDRICRILERRHGVDVDWCDQVYGCDDCGHAIETQPSHAFWSPSYAWDDDAAGYVCFACLGSAGLRWAPASHYSPTASGYVVINPEDWRDRSISSGTMRPEDIVPAMVAALRELGYSDGSWMRAHEKFGTKWDPTEERLAAAVLYSRPGDEADRDLEVTENTWALADILSGVAPDGCYFGPHPGNGSDLGFWEVEE